MKQSSSNSLVGGKWLKDMPPFPLQNICSSLTLLSWPPTILVVPSMPQVQFTVGSGVGSVHSQQGKGGCGHVVQKVLPYWNGKWAHWYLVWIICCQTIFKQQLDLIWPEAEEISFYSLYKLVLDPMEPDREWRSWRCQPSRWCQDVLWHGETRPRLGIH